MHTTVLFLTFIATLTIVVGAVAAIKGKFLAPSEIIGYIGLCVGGTGILCCAVWATS